MKTRKLISGVVGGTVSVAIVVSVATTTVLAAPGKDAPKTTQTDLSALSPTLFEKAASATAQNSIRLPEGLAVLVEHAEAIQAIEELRGSGACSETATDAPAVATGPQRTQPLGGQSDPMQLICQGRGGGQGGRNPGISVGRHVPDAGQTHRDKVCSAANAGRSRIPSRIQAQDADMEFAPYWVGDESEKDAEKFADLDESWNENDWEGWRYAENDHGNGVRSETRSYTDPVSGETIIWERTTNSHGQVWYLVTIDGEPVDSQVSDGDKHMGSPTPEDRFGEGVSGPITEADLFFCDNYSGEWWLAVGNGIRVPSDNGRPDVTDCDDPVVNPNPVISEFGTVAGPTGGSPSGTNPPVSGGPTVDCGPERTQPTGDPADVIGNGGTGDPDGIGPIDPDPNPNNKFGNVPSGVELPQIGPDWAGGEGFNPTN